MKNSVSQIQYICFFSSLHSALFVFYSRNVYIFLCLSFASVKIGNYTFHYSLLDSISFEMNIFVLLTKKKPNSFVCNIFVWLNEFLYKSISHYFIYYTPLIFNAHLSLSNLVRISHTEMALTTYSLVYMVFSHSNGSNSYSVREFKIYRCNEIDF